MTDFSFNIIISENLPVQVNQWNRLAEQNSNIWQTTFYDEVQLFFNNHPVYFQAFDGEELIGGLKVYHYQSKKLPGVIRFISSKIIQGSELIFNAKKNGLFNQFYASLTEEIKKWLKKNSITSFYEYSFFGESEKLIQFSDYRKVWESNIGIATIDLTKSEEELWGQLHLMHRRQVLKAKRNNLIFEIADDIDSFFQLLDETYKNQSGHPPNKNFIRREYEILRSHNAAQIAFVKHNDKFLCGALLYNYGTKSLYNYGGTSKNNLGAGQFLHYEIMRYLKQKNFESYLLGETAIIKNESNIKFSEGISSFKMRFGTQLLPTFHRGYALKPIPLKIWKSIQKIMLRS